MLSKVNVMMKKNCENCGKEFETEYSDQGWCDECEKGSTLPPITGTLEITEPDDSFGRG